MFAIVLTLALYTLPIVEVPTARGVHTARLERRIETAAAWADWYMYFHRLYVDSAIEAHAEGNEYRFYYCTGFAGRLANSATRYWMKAEKLQARLERMRERRQRGHHDGV